METWVRTVPSSMSAASRSLLASVMGQKIAVLCFHFCFLPSFIRSLCLGLPLALHLHCSPVLPYLPHHTLHRRPNTFIFHFRLHHVGPIRRTPFATDSNDPTVESLPFAHSKIKCQRQKILSRAHLCHWIAAANIFRKYFHPIDDESGRNPSISAAFRIFGTLDLASISSFFRLFLPRPVISFKEEQRFCQCGSWRPFYM